MLGSNGQSNGCVSFGDYPKFLQAFLSGEVERLVVVPNLGTDASRTAHVSHRYVGWYATRLQPGKFPNNREKYRENGRQGPAKIDATDNKSSIDAGFQNNCL
ncbi:MAG TPA: hypothetical protein VI137_03400 [Pseudolabrys sp.]|jgi:hypothetical protein